MLSLFQKEILSFLSSITGYIVIIIYTVLTGLFLWLIPDNMNLLDGGTASLAPLFEISPWVFLFLIPAITMRLIAEEKKTGTIELLYTRPLSEFEIVFAKFLAGLALCVIALLPTLIYVFSVGKLGSPAFNFDAGGTWGSYLGLIWLAAVYVSIGVFASSLTDNVIVAFLLAVLLCFLFYSGFDYLSGLSGKATWGELIINLGIDSHYTSMSRGVIDSRDLVYFISVIALFIGATSTKLKSRLW